MDLIKLPQFPSVAASAISTLVTDTLIDRSLHGLVFVRGGGSFTNAHLSNIRVRCDNKDIVNGLTGAQLVDLNEYDGLTDVTNYTFLFFGDPAARTIRGEHLGDIDFSIYRRPLELEVTIGAATTPTLQMYAITGVPKLQMGIGYDAAEAAQMRALLRTVIQPSAAVSRKAYGISIGSSPGARVRRFAFFHTNLTSVAFRKQSVDKWDDIPTALNTAVEAQYARTAQSGLYMLDRIVDGNQGEAESTVKQDGTPWNFELLLTSSGGDTITTFADVHTTLPQI
jgi:coat protein